MTRRIVITGAPGTGKTTLLSALGHLGPVVPEPARPIIAEHRQTTGEPSLDHRPSLFVERLVERSVRDFEQPTSSPITLFDRGLPDCIAYAEILGLETEHVRMACASRRYPNPVFICPPWRSIYTTDDMRKATFEQVEAFHRVVVAAYQSERYDLVEIPPGSIEHRATFVEHALT